MRTVLKSCLVWWRGASNCTTLYSTTPRLKVPTGWYSLTPGCCRNPSPCCDIFFRANKTKDKPVTCFSCGSKRHIAFKCSQFEGLAVHKRWEKFNAFLDGEDTAACCAICLRIGHHDKECLDSKRCGIRGCKDMHHPMLHHDYKTRDKVR